MRQVNLTEFGLVSPKYIGVPQPMLIFHSSAEWNKYVEGHSDAVLLENIADFQAFLKQHDFMGNHTYNRVTDLNVWFATGEKFIPDKFDKMDNLLWKLDGDGHVIKTDNCYIQLHYLYSANNHYTLFCSSGVYNVSLTKWRISAGVKYQFAREETVNRAALRNPKNYERNLKRFMDRKRVTGKEVRLVHLIMNPFSPFFGQPEKATKYLFRGMMKARDTERVLSTDRFQNLFLKELEILMPELKKAFQTEIPDKQMVSMALDIFKKAQEKGTVDDSLKVYEMILAQREELEDGGNYLLNGKPKQEVIEPYNEDMKLPQPGDDEKIDFNAIRKETGAIDGYVIEDEDDSNNDKSSTKTN